MSRGWPVRHAAPQGPVTAAIAACHRVARDRGSASVWVLAFGMAVVLVAGFGAALGTAIVARHRAQAAADLGALAAAVHAQEGGSACDHAARVVAGNRARLVACRVLGLQAVVTAQVSVAGPAGGIPPAEARSRAGPVEWGDARLPGRSR